MRKRKCPLLKHWHACARITFLGKGRFGESCDAESIRSKGQKYYSRNGGEGRWSQFKLFKAHFSNIPITFSN